MGIKNKTGKDQEITKKNEILKWGSHNQLVIADHPSAISTHFLSLNSLSLSLSLSHSLTHGYFCNFFFEVPCQCDKL